MAEWTYAGLESEEKNTWEFKNSKLDGYKFYKYDENNTPTDGKIEIKHQDGRFKPKHSNNRTKCKQTKYSIKK